MRGVSFVEHIEFDFTGPVLRNGLALGDVDNDGNDELVVGNELGDVLIFKGSECWQEIHGLGFVSCVVIGDILNKKQNSLVIVSADGWCHIYHCKKLFDTDKNTESMSSTEGLTSTQTEETERRDSLDQNNYLQRFHVQRIPANSKVALLGDIDSDGATEIVLGLTDRVVRSYRWIDSPQVVSSADRDDTSQTKIEKTTGRLVGLNKWECANQIGSVALHHSSDGSPCLLVAQPGGTFMRIKCQRDGAFGQITENFDMSENKSVRSESFAASLIDYQFLGLSRMRNQNISTEILGDLNTLEDVQKKHTTNQFTVVEETEESKLKGKPYAVATLDGTIMLVQDEIILWAIQVDHQTFALTKLDVTGNGCDDIVVCSWDGQTYILDQEKNSVRFQLDEHVQAFCSGRYTVVPGEKSVPCLVYVTFWNKIYLFYNIQLPSMIAKRFEPDLSELKESEEILENIGLKNLNYENLNRRTKQKIVEYLLYNVQSEETLDC